MKAAILLNLLRKYYNKRHEHRAIKTLAMWKVI